MNLFQHQIVDNSNLRAKEAQSENAFVLASTLLA